jgi:hypothetical protein
MLGQNHFAEPNRHVSFCCALSIYTKMLGQNHFGEPNQYVSFCCTLYLSQQSVQKCWAKTLLGSQIGILVFVVPFTCLSNLFKNAGPKPFCAGPKPFC